MQRSVPWILGLLLILLGAGGWWLLRTPAETPEDRLPREARGGPSVSEGGSAGETPASKPASPTTTVPSTPFSETAEARELPDGADARRIVLLHGVTEAPLPGAVLHIIPASVENALELGAEAVAAHPQAVKRIVNRDGLTSLPGTGRVVVAGLAERLSSETVEIAPDDASTRLRLYPVHTLRFRILDADGIPRRGERLDLRVDSKYFRQPLATKPADSKGRVSFSFPSIVGRYRGLKSIESITNRLSIMARVSGLFAADPSVPIDLGDPPRDEVLIRLPETGQVVVQLEGPSAAVRAVRRVSLRLLDPTQEADPDALLRKEIRGFASSKVERGIAVFRGVGLGTKLEIKARPRKRDLRTVIERVDGPTEAGQEVYVRIALGQEKPRLAWRLCDPEGKPLRNLPFLKGQFRSGKPQPLWARPIQLVPDAEGRLEWSPTRRWIPGTERSLSIEVPMKGEKGPRRLHAKVDLSRHYAPGLTDLGDLILQPMAPIAAGRVTNARGEPIASARVRVGSVVNLDDIDEENGIGFSEALVRELLADMTDADGRFAIYGNWEHGTVCLDVSRNGYVDLETPTLAARRADLELVLGDGGRIAGRVITESPDWTRAAVSIRLRSQDKAQEDHDDNFTPKANGAFTTDDVPPGKWTLEVCWVQRQAPILVVKDLVVAAGETLRDPRLERVDLRDRLRPLAIQVVDPGGEPLAEARISVDRMGPDATGFRSGAWHWLNTTDRNGRTTILSPDARERVLVTLDGYADQHHDLTATTGRIVLQKEEDDR